MALFSGKETEPKMTKADIQMAEFMKKYQLEEFDEKDMIIIKKIASNLAENGLLRAGMSLRYSKAEEHAKVAYLSTLTEQNWMIIRQLSRLNSNIEKLVDK
ncbi:hypothetical protein SAMN05421839_10964 [Halolactibacillus halophilus]|uniref:Uncharacterized protein n=1 Tax=Halolactibacillus halophilus TaxID=306540 RepID=A0A1I5NJP2_9BACI|nr:MULTISPECIES: hypothetical protein [Halolactibacillus]GEM01351.1 hypothetical protein HHA03_08830 [Halolactibacillus halophilus]SFP21546.1 hypothetical protein SAMN05421839_10964 [Halolactibacillus halophilus]